MILVDTSVWIDHLRGGDEVLRGLLEGGQVLAHPFVTGEIALGNLRQRALVLGTLGDLPQALVASEDEVLGFIEQHELHGRGIGYVDVHLLASTRLTADVRIYTRDKRLLGIAGELGLAAEAKSAS
jgi:predicted nucleic acid-binding protein